MCGIAGMVTKDGRPPEKGVLRRMADAIAHRGPDGDGIWPAPGVGLAHLRLSIIDLSDRASQPMHDRHNELVLIFNGEIYNYRELREELGSGVNWKSDSDTEVILEGYRRWEDGVVSRLRGMFAFALWDKKKQRLLLARDRIGKKPLFYTRMKNGDLLFASEIKAFRGICELRPDWQAIRLFLGLQYVPSPKTGFEGVFQLEPGMKGVWENGEWRTEIYHEWNRESRVEASEEEKTKKLVELLEEAVKIRLLAADVPVGAFLSGGIDSAAVVALASRHSSSPLQTFTMGFADSRWDEREAARMVADHFKTKHYDDFEATPEDLLRLVDTLIDHYDAPYADSSALPVWLLAQKTAEQVKVVLTGDGGDEVFGGYRRYIAYQHALLLGRLPSASGATLVRIGELVIPGPRLVRMRETVQAASLDPSRAYGELFCGSYFSTQGINALCKADFLRETNDNDAVQFIVEKMHRSTAGIVGEKVSPLRDAMFFDMTSYLPDDLNVKMDRATMRFELEARAPFLDQKLVQWALGLPVKDKVYHGSTKVLLRKALKPLLPREIIGLPKRGFQVPLAEWFRGPLRAVLEERCLGLESPLRQFMNAGTIQRLIYTNDRGYDHGNRLWMLLSLATWLKRNI